VQFEIVQYGVKFYGTKKLSPSQHKPAKLFFICFAILGLKFSLAHYSHNFFGLCKEQTTKMLKVKVVLLLQQDTTTGPTRWRIFTDLLLLQQQQQQMGFVLQLPKFCLELENVKQRTSRNKTDYEASKQQQAVVTRSSNKEQDGDGFVGSKKMMVMYKGPRG
jgi:hypothetical protein